MCAIMEKEVLVYMIRKSMEHLVNMEWFDIPILRTVGKDNLCLYFISIEQIVTVMPKLIEIGRASCRERVCLYV